MTEYNIHFVRCLKCHKIIECAHYDTSVLIAHIRMDHPDIEIIDSGGIKRCNQSTKAPASVKPNPEIRCENCEQIDKTLLKEAMNSIMKIGSTFDNFSKLPASGKKDSLFYSCGRADSAAKEQLVPEDYRDTQTQYAAFIRRSISRISLDSTYKDPLCTCNLATPNFSYKKPQIMENKNNYMKAPFPNFRDPESIKTRCNCDPNPSSAKLIGRSSSLGHISCTNTDSKRKIPRSPCKSHKQDDGHNLNTTRASPSFLHHRNLSPKNIVLKLEDTKPTKKQYNSENRQRYVRVNKNTYRRCPKQTERDAIFDTYSKLDYTSEHIQVKHANMAKNGDKKFRRTLPCFRRKSEDNISRNNCIRDITPTRTRIKGGNSSVKMGGLSSNETGSSRKSRRRSRSFDLKKSGGDINYCSCSTKEGANGDLKNIINNNIPPCLDNKTSSQKSDKLCTETSILYVRQVKSHSSPSPSNSIWQRRMYRTAIEKWRPGHGTLYCPNCGTTKRPLIKTRLERVSNNPCGATCLLGCWPFCFLPFLIPGNNREYLHCANCKNFLGLYDRENNCVRPNRRFCESPKRK